MARPTREIDVTISHTEAQALPIIRQQRADDLASAFRILGIADREVEPTRRTIRVVMDFPGRTSEKEAHQLLHDEIGRVLSAGVSPLEP